MITIAIGVLLSTVVIQFVAGLLPGVEVESWVSAFWTALIMALFGSAAMFLWVQVDAGAAFRSGLPLYIGLLVINTVSFGLAAVAVDGVRVRHPISLLLAGVALTAAGFGVQLVAARIASVVFGT